MATFTPDSLPSLVGKVYLVTGGSAGIGYESVVFLAKKGARVYMGARSDSKGRAAIASIRSNFPEADIQLLMLDHMNLSSVVLAAKEFAKKEPRLHGLVNNAGIMALPFEESMDGYEAQWQTNHVAHWLLTYHLLPTLLATAKSAPPGEVRVVSVSSGGHRRFAPKEGIAFEDINQQKGGEWSRYGQSKLANVLLAKHLNSLYGPEGSKKVDGEIWSASLHPGNIYTDLSKNARFMSGAIGSLLNFFGVFISPEQGAYNTVFCAASQAFKSDMSGQYFEPFAKVANPSRHAKDADLARKLWDWTETEMKQKGLL